MLIRKSNLLPKLEAACASLLNELQIIWDEVGESDDERERTLLELEQECLEVYRRKVDEANQHRAQLRQTIAVAETELAAICSAMGEPPVHIRQSDQNTESLKYELRAILPQLEDMRKKRNDRKDQFIKVLQETQNIKNEIFGTNGFIPNDLALDDSDLSIRKLEELQRELVALQKEKGERLKLLADSLNCLYSFCLVLGLNFKKTVSEIHPSLVEVDSLKEISNGIIEQLATTIQNLRELKIQRMQQLQDLATSLLELWNLMDTPIEEQQTFHKVTCNLVASEEEITEPDMLSVDYFNFVAAEVSRLEELKVSKMKELVLKKKGELEAICRKTHLIPETDSALNIAIDSIESEAVDTACLLEQIELQIASVKEEALSRKEILEKVEKWMAACEEENWLEEYNRDDNRYNAGRGAHLILKRAEKARILVNRLPAMVDTLAAKTLTWEKERGIEFMYDGVRLLSMLEGYTTLRKEKELEQKRQRDQKKLQGQLLAEQEAIYGSKPSPVKIQTTKKGSRLSCNGLNNRRLSLGVPMLETPKPDMPRSARTTPNTHNAKKNGRINKEHNNDGFTAPSSGRRVLDVPGLLAKQPPVNLVNARDQALPMARKPFSPISCKNSSKANTAKVFEDLNRKHEETLQKANKTPFTTPQKIMPEENRTTPQTATSAPSTPSTVSVPMPTPITPASVAPLRTALIPALLTGKAADEEIEYSFEERRAGFRLPRSLPPNAVQVQH